MRFFQILILPVFFFMVSTGYAQTFGRFEPGIKWNNKFNDHFSADLSSGARILYINDNEFDFSPSFISLNGMLNYGFGKNIVSAGFVFRFYDLFDDDRTTEKRIVQQFITRNTLGSLKWKGQVRLEERFSNYNSFRQRYLAEITLPIKLKEGKRNRVYFSAKNCCGRLAME